MPLTKFNKFFLNEAEDVKIRKTLISKINKKNCLVLYCLSKIFKLSSSVKASISLIEQSFSIFAGSDNFLELEFKYITKILSSSGLNIDSELQVLNAADSWLCYDISKRSKYAKELLSNVRLSLLSIPALYHILENNSLSVINECASSIKDVFWNKQHSRTTNCNVIRRYCTTKLTLT